MKSLWSSAMLREDQLRGIKVGTRIVGRISAISDGDQTFEVYYISPLGNCASWRAANNSGSYDLKTFEVRARPEHPIDGLRPGTSVIFKYPFEIAE